MLLQVLPALRGHACHFECVEDHLGSLNGDSLPVRSLELSAPLGCCLEVQHGQPGHIWAWGLGMLSAPEHRRCVLQACAFSDTESVVFRLETCHFP